MRVVASLGTFLIGHGDMVAENPEGRRIGPKALGATAGLTKLARPSVPCSSAGVMLSFCVLTGCHASFLSSVLASDPLTESLL